VTLLQLFGVFALLSIFGFGGGQAILPQMHADVVDHYHWITSPQFTQFFAIARLAPGPTMTMSSLIGYAVAGPPGALVAFLAIFLPGAIVTALVGRGWSRIGESPVRAAVAAGLAPVVIGLMWAGAVAIGRGAIDSLPTILIALVAAAMILWTRITTPLVIGAAAVAGGLFLR
jgi:chromate transporter